MSIEPATLYYAHSTGSSYLPGGLGPYPVQVSPCAVCGRIIRDVQPTSVAHHVYDVCSFRCGLAIEQRELAEAETELGQAFEAALAALRAGT